MTINTDRLMVILSLIVISMILIGSCVVSFRFCDLAYLIILYGYVIRYIYIKKRK